MEHADSARSGWAVSNEVAEEGVHVQRPKWNEKTAISLLGSLRGRGEGGGVRSSHLRWHVRG